MSKAENTPTFTPRTLRLVSEDCYRIGAKAERKRIAEAIEPHLRMLRRLSAGKGNEAIKSIKAALLAKAGVRWPT